MVWRMADRPHAAGDRSLASGDSLGETVYYKGVKVHPTPAAEPTTPLVLVAFDRTRRIVPALQKAGRYAVNILGEEGQDLSDCFAGGPAPAIETGRGDDERADLCGAAWLRGATGLPVLADAVCHLRPGPVPRVPPAGSRPLR